MRPLIRHFYFTCPSFVGIITYFVFICIFFSCSQHSNTVVSKTFHNTTARYNAYFLARERMKEVEAQIKKKNIDDYNKVLKVFPVIDKSTASGLKSDLDYIIEKAALPVNKHKNSKWVDDSYNLIGKARLYHKEYKLATETFKYVNTKSKDKNARHAAMILLLRTFLDSLQIENARAVNDYLKKEKVTTTNAAGLYMTRAALFHVEEDYDKMRANLEKSVKYIKKKEDRARVYFIIGQIYQEQEELEKAYENYSKVFKNNPPYELFFYARLYLGQVTNLESGSDKKKMDKYFKKLLKDLKNVEYRDKIYYEMGKYEHKQSNYSKAIEHFQSSLKENGNPFQKARTYLALGKLYYDDLRNFKVSKLYYDSTASHWDKTDKDYESIVARQKILDEFVGYLEIIEREDSLQRLAKMSPAELDKFFDKILIEEAIQKQKEQEALKEKQKEAKNAANMAALNQAELPSVTASSTKEWYFYSASAVATGHADFTKNWGNRKLEDDWRRSAKQTGIEFNEDSSTQKQAATVTPEKQAEDSLATVKARKEKMMQDIPSTPALIDSSNAKVEVAMYEVGKIYHLKLDEPKNAVKTFKTHIDRFPSSEYKPEIYYLLYLIYKSLNDQEYSTFLNLLRTQFPNSTYARIIKNPNYLAEHKAMNLEAGRHYKQAFELYKARDYISSDSMVQQINRTYPENDIKDKLQFLSVLNKGATQSPLAYRDLANKFINDYPDSPLIPRAQELIATLDTYIEEQQKQGYTIQDQIKFLKNFDQQPHSFLCTVDNKMNTGYLSKEFKRYTTGKTDPEEFTFSDSTSAILIHGFENREKAQDFLDRIQNEKKFKNLEPLIQPVIISSDNLKILKQSGNTAAYLEFFKKHYNEHLIYGEG